MFYEVETHIALLQNYIACSEKQAFIDNLKSPTEKLFLRLLTADIDNIEQYKKELNKLEVSDKFREAILKYKLQNFVENGAGIPNKKLLLELKNMFSPYSNFSYEKPANIRREEMANENEDFVGKINILSRDVSDYINKKVQDNASIFSSLNSLGISVLAEKTLLRLQFKAKEQFLRQANYLMLINPSTLKSFFRQYAGEYKKEYKRSEGIQSIPFPFEKLTKQQLNILGKENEDLFHNFVFCKEWINQNFKRFAQEYCQAAFCSLEKQAYFLQTLLKIKEELMNHSKSFIISAFQFTTLTEILATQIELGAPKQSRLKQYLNHQISWLSDFQFFAEKFKSKFNKVSSSNKRQIVDFGKNGMSQQINFRGRIKGIPQLVEDYLIELFKQQDSNKLKSLIEKLGQIIQMQYLKKLEIKVKLMAGIKCQEATDYWNHNQLAVFKEKKQIKISQRNKQIFKPADDVILSVSLKNVKQLQIKVYQLNLLKEYLNNNSPESKTYDDINLTYFSPSSTDFFVNPSDNPFELKQVNIQIKDIPQRIGIFVVDLLGEGITSRAVIRKGSIICLNNCSLAGQYFSFYNEQGKQLSEEDGLNVWVQKHKQTLLQGKFFNSSSALEIEKRSEATQIIVSLGCFAQKFTKNTKEFYNINLSAIYNSESFIKQSKAKVILKASLKLNNKLIPLSKLKNIRAVVNQKAGKVIMSSNIFDFTEWSEDKEQLVQFFPQPDITTISIQLKAQVPDKKDICLESNAIQIRLSSETQEEEGFIAQPYLSKLENDSYQISLKGKNGEGIPQKEVNLQFTLKGVSQQELFKFVTDKEGNIQLGKLSAVRFVSYIFGSFHRTWTIDRTLDLYNYDNVMYAFPGQRVNIPINKTWTSKDVFLLHCLSQGQRSDETQIVSIKEGVLTFPVTVTEQSCYKLILIPVNVEIKIMVIGKGVKWQQRQKNQEIVVDAIEGKIMQIKRGSQLRNVFIGGMSLDYTNPDLTVCKVLLNNFEELPKEDIQKIRVHVLATNYISPRIQGEFGKNDYFMQSTISEQWRKISKATYLSNKTLSEEAAYICNRQKEKGRIGNNLQKPGLFLKRLEVRDTSNVVGQLEGQGKFEVQDNSKKDLLNQVAGFTQAQIKYPYITKHNSFLGHSGSVSHNIQLGASFEVPAGYSHLEVYLITPENGTKAVFSLRSKETAMKDVRYKGLLQCNEGKAWNISREVYNLKKQEHIHFSKKCEFKTVTLTDVFEYAQKIIFAGKGDKLYSWKDILLGWSSFSNEQKIKEYNKYYCHELNTFIKFKDPQFFQKVVRPFIQNKFKKTFIDLCLLEDKSVCSYLQLNQLLLLNNFQYSLLAFVLAKLNLKEEAKRVVEKMELTFSKSLPYKVKSVNFDYIINSFAGKEEVAAIKRSDSLSKNQKADRVVKAKLLKRQNSEMCCSEMMPMPMRGQAQVQRSESSEQYQHFSEDQCDFKIKKDKKDNEVGTTKEYTQLTFYYQEEQKYPLHERKSIQSPFWAELARHFLEGGNGDFISSSFTEFQNSLEIMLAAAFIPGQLSSTFALEDACDKYKLTASVALSLFVKEQKQYQYQQKDGIYIYQTISTFSALEPTKEVIATQIRAGQQYYLSTIFSNSTSDFHDLQILCPIPEGSIPLKSKDVTILQNNLGPFKTDVYKQAIYFPCSGLFKLPPANILNMKSGIVISRSPANLPVSVLKANQNKKLQSFEDVIQYGSKAQILSFLKEKNIFSADIFKPQLILWMLGDAEFFEKIVTTLRERFYFEPEIWKFSLLHGDCKTIREYLNLKNISMATNPLYFVDNSTMQRLNSVGNEAFEYYPYFQKRTHRYASQSRSSIKCVDLKQTYIKFLIFIASSSSYRDPKNKIAHAYYLILQDRLLEADKLINQLSEEQKAMCELQVDYIRCFLDMGLNGEKCELARKIAPKYADYPIGAWRKLFLEISQTLKAPPANESSSKQTLQTKVTVLQNGDISIKRSPKKQIKIEIFPTNVELLFSQHSFELKKSISNFSISKPIREIVIDTNNFETAIIINKEEFNSIGNPYIQISEHSNRSHRKIKSILWTDPRIITKIHEQEGVIQVFIEGNRATGCYVKVFTTKKGVKRPTTNSQYYVDGYTDIAGKFRYALTDLQTIEEFAILIITQIGAIVKYVFPPQVKEDAQGRKRRSNSSSSDSSSSSSISSSSGSIKEVEDLGLIRQYS